MIEMKSNNNFIIKDYLENYSFLFKDSMNIFNIEEIIISSIEEVDLYLQLFECSNKIESIYYGNFSIKLNNKYLLIYDTFKLSIKEFYTKFISKVRKFIFKDMFMNDILNLFLFLNFILVFSPEFYTIYNIKKEILSKSVCKFGSISENEIYFSELLFINIINEANRKCSLSWDYRYFILKKLNKNIITTSSPSASSLTCLNKDPAHLEKIHLIVKLLKNYIDIFEITINHDDELNMFLLFDLALILKINEKEKRNYHLWKYLIKSIDLEFDISKLLILSFCFHLFVNDPNDYSAYSNIINIYPKTSLKSSVKMRLKNYLLDVWSINKELIKVGGVGAKAETETGGVKGDGNYFLNLISLI